MVPPPTTLPSTTASRSSTTRYKLSDADELEIEALLDTPGLAAARWRRRGRRRGLRRPPRGALWLEPARAADRGGLCQRRVLNDRAVGVRAPRRGRRRVAATPDGHNINVGCGATDLALLQSVVREGGHDLGVAFDGDGDRMLAVDGAGEVVDGDQIVAICALALGVDLVAVTTMTNLGFHRLMDEHGVRVVTTDVGDRYVLEALRREGGDPGRRAVRAPDLLDGHATGDGLAAASCSRGPRGAARSPTPPPSCRASPRRRPTSRCRPPFRRRSKPRRRAWTPSSPAARVLVRPSGTEPVVRVLAEAERAEEAVDVLCASIAHLVRQEAGAGKARAKRGIRPDTRRRVKGGRMCGIIGYVGSSPAKALLLSGSSVSSTAATTRPGSPARGRRPRHVRAVGNLDQLKARRAERRRRRRPGSGTRAGRRTAASRRRTRTRSPAATRQVAIVLNGIVENYRELRERSLIEDGHAFTVGDRCRGRRSLDRAPLRGRPRRGGPQAYAELEGHFAFVVIHHDHPDLLVGARLQCPLVVASGEDEMFLASNDRGFPARDADVQLPRTARWSPSRRRAPGSSSEDGPPASTSDRARLGRRGRREGRLRDVHAQGDLRAAGARRGDDRRPRAPRQGLELEGSA